VTLGKRDTLTAVRKVEISRVNHYRRRPALAKIRAVDYLRSQVVVQGAPEHSQDLVANRKAAQ
jgi:hypothetical protein